MLRPAAMANLLGDLWQPGEPNWTAACQHPEAKLHLYGKLEPRPGRKMGHITATAETPAAAEALVRAARASLTSSAESNPAQTPRNTAPRSPHTSDAYTPNPK